MMKTQAQTLKTCLVLGFLTVIAVTVMSTDRAAAQGVIRINSCPYIIVAPGQYLVTQDLFCPFTDGIQVDSSNVKLNVGGHTITGSPLGRGITVFQNRQNVEIRNGTVTGFSFGMLLEFGSSEVRIEAMTVIGNQDGLLVNQSDDNTITSSEFSDNFSFGVIVLASGNVFRGNKVNENTAGGYLFQSANNNLITSTKASASIITGNQSNGVLLSGSDNNTVQSSQVLGNLSRGIQLDGGGNNTVRSNTVKENGQAGITLGLSSTANTVVSNTATDNAVFDLEDLNPNCDANVWRKNNFNTANQPQCID